MQLIVAYSLKAYILANAWKIIAFLSVKLATACCAFSIARTIYNRILPGESCFQENLIYCKLM